MRRIVFGQPQRRLCRSQARVYGFLKDYAAANNGCIPSNIEIAERLNMSPANLSSVILRLRIWGGIEGIYQMPAVSVEAAPDAR